MEVVFLLYVGLAWESIAIVKCNWQIPEWSKCVTSLSAEDDPQG